MKVLTKKNSRSEERASIRAFVRYLHRADRTIKQINFVTQHPDPPDFWVTISGIKYPVEVTKIVSESLKAYDGLCKSLIKDIRLRLSKSGGFKGKYLLNVIGEPYFGKNPNNTKWRNLVTDVANEILSEEINWEYDPRAYSGGYFLLDKILGYGSEIGLLLNHPSDSRELQDLISKVILRK